MTSSISDTTHSPAPFSPFSTHSGDTDLATSDGERTHTPLFRALCHAFAKTNTDVRADSPDLGAFTIVFRALNEYQPPRSFVPHAHAHAVATTTATTTTLTHSPAESESDVYNRGSTVWAQQPIASYLSSMAASSSYTATGRLLSVASQSPPPSEPPSSDTEGEIMIDQEEADSGDYEDANNADEGQPSLGWLDGALQFIAAERAKLTAPRDNSWQQRGNSSTSDDPSSHRQQQQQVPHHHHHYHPHHHQHQQLVPRRRRRNRKARSIVPTVLVRESSGAAGDDHHHQPQSDPLEGEDPSDHSSPDISSSDAAIRFRSTPGSPRRKAGRRNSVRSASADARPRLSHSKSTPNFRSGPLDPRVVRLRALAIKLKFLFAAEAELLAGVLSNESLQSSTPDFIDPRGPPPRPGQALVHVFID